MPIQEGGTTLSSPFEFRGPWAKGGCTHDANGTV